MSRIGACRKLGEVEPWRQCVSCRAVFTASLCHSASSTLPSSRTQEQSSGQAAQRPVTGRIYDGTSSLNPLDQLVPLETDSALAPPAVAKTPPVLEKAVSDLQRDLVQDHPKRFRQLGKALVQSLKMKSLSRHRGGLQPNFFDAKQGPRPVFRGSDRQEEKRALKALADLGSVDSSQSDVESIQQMFESHPSYDILKRAAEEQRLRAQVRDLVPSKMYNGLGALAYATARLPSTYAAVQNVFQRLKMSRVDSGWMPGTMLDFGAGPGTAAWAARAVWPSARLRVTNVEGSASMADVGYQISRLAVEHLEQSMTHQEGQENGHVEEHIDAKYNVREESSHGDTPSAPDVRWIRGLPRDRIENKYDICVASYSLNELRGPVERHKLLHRLMRSANEYIVLIEHGTPHGFAIIEDSRRYVLKVSRKLGIPFHVAAPCAHDGACPLRGKRAWCHFSQRHTRTMEQRVAVKSLTGKAPRDTYAERFSYVVLKRGLRDGESPLLQPHSNKSYENGVYGSEEIGRELQDIKRIQELMLQRVRSSRILRRRKRKGHVMLDLCSVLDADGSLINDGSGTILRQTVSKGKSKSSWDGGRAYKASKSLCQGDEWPLVFQAGRGNSIESPIVEDAIHETEDATGFAEAADLFGMEFEDDDDRSDNDDNGWSDDDFR